jgi:hypothetical protein
MRNSLGTKLGQDRLTLVHCFSGALFSRTEGWEGGSGAGFYRGGGDSVAEDDAIP